MIAFSLSNFFDILVGIHNENKSDRIKASDIYKKYIEENDDVSKILSYNPMLFRLFLLELYRMGIVDYQLVENHIYITKINVFDLANYGDKNDIILKNGSFNYNGRNLNMSYFYYNSGYFSNGNSDTIGLIIKLFSSYVFIDDNAKKNAEKNEKYHFIIRTLFEKITGNVGSQGLIEFNRISEIDLDEQNNNDFINLLSISNLNDSSLNLLWNNNHVIRDKTINLIRQNHINISGIYYIKNDEILLSYLHIVDENKSFNELDQNHYKTYLIDTIGEENEVYEGDSDYNEYDEDEDEPDFDDYQEEHEYRWDGFDVKKLRGRSIPIDFNDDYKETKFSDDDDLDDGYDNFDYYNYYYNDDYDGDDDLIDDTNEFKDNDYYEDDDDYDEEDYDIEY